MFYTYAHYKPDNSVFYIGKGHGRRAWSVKDRSQYWKRVIAKHGSHHVELLSHWHTEKEAFEHEKFLIWCFRDMGYQLANLTDGGEGCSGFKHSIESIERSRQANIGKKLSDKHIAILKKCNTGRKHSEETKAYLSKLNKERVLTEEQKQRIREGRIGKKHSEETKKKLSILHIGKTMSAEHKAIISATHKGKKQSKEQIEKRIASKLLTLASRKTNLERK